MAVLRVSGYPGAGKSTLCKMLAHTLGYQYFYAGTIFRELAAQAGVPIEEYYQELAKDPGRERAIDDRQRVLMAATDNLIIEGRVAPFLPSPFQSVNILLTVDPTESARRQHERSENAHRSIEEIRERTTARVTHEREHYHLLYGILDHFSPEHYDIVLDTTRQSAQQALAATLKELKQRFKIVAAAQKS